MKPTRPISVTQAAKNCNLSRQRFYDLVKKGIFPEPDRSLSRPMYSPELQITILSVMETGVGANGEFVLFNAKRSKTKQAAEENNTSNDTQPVVESLAALGLSVTRKQVDEAIKELAISEPTSPDSIKSIFLHLKS
ncbi:hypothetical protein N9Y42_01800 [Mariniblastus sp.]|nr:hypothetical protein [Mariniblastus sp.]